MRALSIRQPFAELILRGIKTVEYRWQPTRIFVLIRDLRGRTSLPLCVLCVSAVNRTVAGLPPDPSCDRARGGIDSFVAI
jgi:hypothetical protein